MSKVIRALSPWLAASVLLLLPVLAGCGSSTVEPDRGHGDSGDGDGDSGDGDGDSGDGDGDSGDGDSGDGDSGDGDSGDGDSGDGDTGGDDADDPDPPKDPGIEIADFMAPAYEPPGGLKPEEVPQFVVLGFDDNRYTDGFKWVLDELAKRKNPQGKGNASTHDGDPLIVSFYFTTDSLDMGGDELLAQWKRAVAAGHEVGNHTHTHRALENEGVPWDWAEEIDKANDILTRELGVAKEDIIGFRAPFLQFESALYDTLTSRHMLYDCSIIHYPVGKDGEDWQFFRHIWPYTLDNDVDTYAGGGFKAGAHAGIWEVPVYTVPRSGDRKTSANQPIAGFDSTAWGTVGESAEAYLEQMKWALDLRLEAGDSRAPMTLGVHTDTYSEEQTAYPQTTLDARRAALTGFIDYALSKPEVRFVSAKQLLQWMSKPTAL
jgi:hypothetical protein